ncbi:hypothetical protein HF086_000409 [Spodoptera exigua]|uniref:Uncharacterized protein n=1 Tax=Spodoptera exigua TaxID=7107 RepID=A0A922SD74_SPOEX|nr:hypothetical protein HF086_000409 [Spodoptera exigua]
MIAPASPISHSNAPASPSVAPSSPASYSVPSPAIAETDLAFVTGSDDSESSDEEGEIAAPHIPRVYQSLMETPLDQEDDVGNAGDELATHITPASGLELADAPLMATEQPWGLLQFDWRKFPNPPPSPESRRETFSVINVGPTTPHITFLLKYGIGKLWSTLPRRQIDTLNRWHPK